MKQLLTLVVCLAIMGNIGQLHAQDSPELVTFSSEHYSILRWSSESGLPQNNIKDLAQGPDGHIWIATYDGLVRFDGYSFKTFHQGNTAAFTSSFIISIEPDIEGNIWISTEHDLIKYDGETFTTVERPGEKSFKFWRVNDDLYAGSEKKVYRLDHDEFKLIYSPAKVGEPIIEVFWQEGVLVRTGKDIILLNDEKTKTISTNDSFEYVGRNLYRKADDKTNSKFYKRRGYEFVQLDTVLIREDNFGMLRQKGLRKIRELPNRDLIYTYDEDLVIQSGNSEFIVGIVGGLNVSDMSSFLVDRQGLIWVGTFSTGLLLLIPKVFQSINHENSDLFRPGFMCYQGPDSTYWFDDGCNGLVSTEDVGMPTTVRYTGLCPWTIVQTDNKTIWVGDLTRGVIQISGDTLFELLNYSDSLGQLTHSIYEDVNDNIWVGTDKGVYTISNGELMFVEGSASSGKVYQFYEDRTGQLLVSCLNGVGRINSDGTFDLNTLSGFPTTDIRTIYQDEDGYYWLGTSSFGLILSNKRSTYHFSFDDGRINRNVWSIVEDSLGFLWMSSNNGIYRLNRRELIAFASGKGENYTSTVFDKYDGLYSSEGNSRTQNKGFMDFNGNIWFSTISGPVVINPYKLPLVDAGYPIKIDEVFIDDAPVNMAKPIVVGPDAFQIQFKFSHPVFYHNKHARYAYKVDGLDERWFDVGQSRQLTFSDLPSGEFVLQLKMVGTKIGTEIQFTVQVPMTETDLFKNSMIIGAMIILFIATNFYLRRRRKRKKEHKQLTGELTRLELEAMQALRKSEELYRSLFERNLSGIYRADINGVIIECNDAFARIIGYDSRKDVINKHARELYDNLSAKDFSFDLISNDSRLKGWESMLKLKNGDLVWVLENSSIIHDNIGGVLYIEGSIIDITEVKIAKIEIEELAKFPAENPNPVLRVSSKNNIIYTNKAAESLVEFMTNDSNKLIDPMSEFVQSAFDQQKSVDIEHSFDGRHYLISINPSMESEYSNIYVKEITEKKNTLLKLEKEKKIALQYQSMLLSSQLNPHFIFNSLNSIQYYILDKDQEPALEYLSDFSTLMRSVLHNSTQQHISLELEIEFLEMYLNLEISRHANRFSYDIGVSDEIDPTEIIIPPMLLQPFIENTVIHGVGHLESGGLINIYFEKKDDSVLCRILDNGVGRKESERLKFLKTGNYFTSHSTSINITRLEILNALEEHGYSSGIEDQYDADGKPSGTLVTVKFPLIRI